MRVRDLAASTAGQMVEDRQGGFGQRAAAFVIPRLRRDVGADQCDVEKVYAMLCRIQRRGEGGRPAFFVFPYTFSHAWQRRSSVADALPCSGQTDRHIREGPLNKGVRLDRGLIVQADGRTAEHFAPPNYPAKAAAGGGPVKTRGGRSKTVRKSSSTAFRFGLSAGAWRNLRASGRASTGRAKERNALAAGLFGVPARGVTGERSTGGRRPAEINRSALRGGGPPPRSSAPRSPPNFFIALVTEDRKPKA